MMSNHTDMQDKYCIYSEAFQKKHIPKQQKRKAQNDVEAPPGGVEGGGWGKWNMMCNHTDVQDMY